MTATPANTMQTTDKEVRTTCPYCGVGCGVLATPNDDGTAQVRGDTEHPANFGRLCSKGAALGATVDLSGRLLYPEIAGARVSWDNALSHVASSLQTIIETHGRDAVALYVSGQLLTEDYYVANKFCKGAIGTANIDTNSRLCMSSSVAGHKRAFGSDTVPGNYEDLEQADLVVLTGSNTAWCHPVLFQRISKAKTDRPGCRVIVIDPRRTATCEIADLHLPLALGSDVALFNGLLVYLADHDAGNPWFVEQFTSGSDAALKAAREDVPTLADVARRCDLNENQLREFYEVFTRTTKVVTVYSQGVNQSSSGTDKVNAIINCHLYTGRIGRPGMGPFSVTGQPNAMGGREVGGLANQLAAHMDLSNAQHRELVGRFWNSDRVPDKPGLLAVDMFRAVGAGKIKAIWIIATNPVVSLPDADSVRDALSSCELVIVSDCIRNTDTTRYAHVLLPALAWGEKDGTVTNSERRISRQRSFLPVPGEAKADWWIVGEVAKRMGYGASFNFADVGSVFREHAALSGFENAGSRDFDLGSLANLSVEQYDNLQPVQWPARVGNASGTARMFGDGRFYHPDTKARFIAIQTVAPKNLPTDDFPLALNTGRVRDQWHTMTRTARAARLNEHTPEPYAEIHPQDAQRFAVVEGGLVQVISRWGEVIVRAVISTNARRGSVFVPMHWNDQFASHARIDAVVNPAVDPISGQPELKHTPVRIRPYTPKWHGFLLSRRALTIDGVSYWVRANGRQFIRYELAGEQRPDHWPSWARQLLCAQDNDVSWVEYSDARAGRYRGVRMIGKRVESCIFVAPTPELPSREWLASLFDKESLDESERGALLRGQPPAGQQDIGPIVCACFSVGRNTLIDCIRSQQAGSVEAIGKALRAGTNCGSCIPELKTLLALQKKV